MHSGVTTVTKKVWYRHPKQRRSRDTLERMLGSAETLLAKKGFEEITISEVVTGARTSVGAFYKRFSGKAALLQALYDRYSDELAEMTERNLRTESYKGATLENRVRRLMKILVGAYTERRGFLRAMILHARVHPDAIPGDQRNARSQFYDRLASILLGARAEIHHPSPRRAVDLALFAAVSACRERILFAAAPHPSALGIPEKGLADDLSDLLIRYLTAPSPRRRRTPKKTS